MAFNRTFLVLASLASVGAAQALVVIDNFSTSQPRLTLYLVSNASNTASAGTFAFSTRVQHLFQDSNTAPEEARNTSIIRGGIASYSSDMEVDGRYSLIYSQPGTSGINLTNLQTLKFDFVSNDLPFTLQATVFTYNPVGSVSQSATSSVTVGSSLSPFSVLVNGWSGPLHWSNVVGMTFDFDPVLAGDFSLDQVEAVPEPASMLALGAGAAALIARRRRRK